MIIKLRYKNRKIQFNLQRHSDYSSFYLVYVEKSYQHLLEVIRPVNVVIDAGANIGIFTVLSSILVGKQGVVVSIEPNPENLKVVRENIELNTLTNVTVVDRALWSSSNVEVSLVLKGVMSRIQLDGKDVQSRYANVKTVTFDDLVDDLKLVPTVLTMDIEGAEKYALKKVSKTFESLKHVEAEIHDRDSEDAIMSFSGFDFEKAHIENFGEVWKFAFRDPIKTANLERHNRFETSKRVLHRGTGLGDTYPYIIYMRRR
ncbi:MAG: FkbM family methyltransferase [Candidatus Thermoplasmatota archaeon]|nr:FkbM family methyltransferase [Candidatus Thermoplasmatota archaeon]